MFGTLKFFSDQSRSKKTTMKRQSLLALALMLSSLAALAQNEFKPFKVDLSLGYANPRGDGAKAGVLFAVEPKYQVIPAVAVGLRIETAVVARGLSGGDNSFSEAEVKAAGSYLLTGDYYFSENYSFRPFVGAGAGIFRLAAARVSDDSETVNGDASTKFGGVVRAGFEARHFRLGLEYNIVPDATLEDLSGNGNSITSKNAYIGIKLGICIGGGPR